MSNSANNYQQNIDPILNFDPWYLRPPKEAQEIKHTDYYIKHNEKKKGNRKVYQKVQYDEFEKQHIEIIQQEMERQQIQVPPDWKTSDYLKMCYCGRFDLKKDIKAAKEHIEWRNNVSVHTLDDKAKVLLQNGMIYLLGRDSQFRPIVYLDCTKINLKRDGEETILKAICVFLDMVKRYMFLDYYIENWIMVIDTGCLGLTSLPINGLKLIIGSMSINYCATMDKMFILNPSFMLNTSWNIIKGFIDPESVDKMQFLKPKDYKEMQKKIPVKYLQKKYGGEHQDLTQYWPPINVYCTDEERAKLLKNQNMKQKDKEIGSAQISPNKKQQQKKDEKPGISTQSNESNKQKPDSTNMGKSNSREINTNGANGINMNTNTANNYYANPPIQNDGIKPKIIVITVPDDKIDSRYANAGYDEQLESRLREESERKRIEAEQAKKLQLQREDSQTQSGSQAFNIKKGVLANSSAINGGNSNTATGTTNAAPGIHQMSGNTTNNNTTINNINITSTDYSEINHPSPAITQKNNKNYHSAVPDIIDSKQEDSTQNNAHKYQNNDEETDPMIFEPHNMQNNPIIQFEGDDSASASKCCQNCNIF